MINDEQEELLLRLIGAESVFFQYFKNFKGINQGTKIYYLEEAMNQDSQTFLSTLDRLYHFELQDTEKTAQIILNGLKLINDLYFNNPVKLVESNTALQNYFGSLGEVNFDEFKVRIVQIINSNISLLSFGVDEELILKQKKDCELSETDRVGNRGWRMESNSPPAQLMAVLLSNSTVASFFAPKSNYSYREILKSVERISSGELSPDIKNPEHRRYTIEQLVNVLRCMEESKPEQDSLSFNGTEPRF